MVSKVDTFFIFVLFAVALAAAGGVASGEALVMLHREMPHVLLQHLHMAIQMACDGGAFVRCCRLFCLA